MSKMTLDIVASVRNQASTPLKQIEKAVRQTGTAIKKSTDDIFAFNRAAFHASLFLNNYLRSIKGLSQDIEEGARLDRLEQEYTRILGPSGDLAKQIRQFTDVSIDQMEAMRAGIALKTLGISTSTRQVAEMVSMAGVAAKQAGQDSGEGIRKFTEFLKTGNLELIQSLNLVRTADPALRTQMQLLGKYGGVLSSALTAQEKLAIGMTALRRATQGNMKGNRDLLDTILDLKQYWKMLTSEIGIVIGKALQPLMEMFIDFVIEAKAVLSQLRTMDQGFLFLVKSIMVTTTALTGLIAAVGAFRLTVKGLGAIGFGVPKLITLVAILGFVFTTLTSKVDKAGEAFSKGPFGKVIEKVRVFGAALRGIFEAVTTAFKPENQVKGIGQISKSVADLLEQYGLIKTEMIGGQKVITGGIVQNISKYTYLLAKFLKDVFDTLMDWKDKVLDIIDNVSKKFNDIFSIKTKLIPRSWLDETNQLRMMLVKTAAAMLLISRFGFMKNILSKLPVVGRLFGSSNFGTGKGPTGKASDPIWTRSADTAVKGILGAGRLTPAAVFKDTAKIFGALFKGTIGAVKKENQAATMAQIIRTSTAGATGTAGFLEASIFTSLTSIGNILGNFVKETGSLFIIFNSLEGFISGLNMDQIGKFFSGLYDLATSFSFEIIQSAFSKFASTISGIVDTLMNWLKKIPGMAEYIIPAIQAAGAGIQESWKTIGGATSYYASEAGAAMSKQALSNRVTTGLERKSALGLGIEGGDTSATRLRAVTSLIDELRSQQANANADLTSKAMRLAMKAGSDAEGNITESEFALILKAAFTNSLNESDFTKHAKDINSNTKPKTKEPTTQNRGGC